MVSVWDEILKAIPLVVLPSAFKFIVGPLAGYSAGLHYLTTSVATIAGMMSSVVAFTYFGAGLRKLLDRLFPNRKRLSESRSRWLPFLMKHGIKAIAILTPALLTPIGGTLIASSLVRDRRTIIVYMLVSATAWSFSLNGLVYYFGDSLLRWLNWGG